MSRRAFFPREPNALTRALEKKKPIVDLTVSNPTRTSLPYDAYAITAALADARSMIYEPAPLGLASARECISRLETPRPLASRASRTKPRHSSRLHGSNAPNVMLTSSTSEAYSILLKLLCDPGDAILVPAPSYPLFGPLATFEGVETISYPLHYDGAWHVGELPRDPRARAVFCVSPNNPTGSILGGLSKFCALPQMKLAWTLINGPGADETMRTLEWICDAYLSVGAPVQHALPRLIDATKKTREALFERVQKHLQHLRDQAKNRPFTVLDVEAGWYACVRLPATQSEEAWTLELLDRGVLVHPGHFFDFEDEPYAVVSLIADDFAHGVRLMIDACA